MINNLLYFFVIFFGSLKNGLIFATRKRDQPNNDWEHSSAGSEHLPYKQGVTGSNPVAPTSQNTQVN
ncbi:MAG: hypothetical protein H6Q15_834 [Bacteroidetes bacterium]|nr:hypothetical protein [Bacteroidota bacterium]